MEDVVVPELDEIVHADEMAGHSDPGVGNRQQNAVEEWIGDKEREQRHGWQNQAKG